MSNEGKVEVAHEAILRQWPALVSWIAEEQEWLRAYVSLEQAVGDWAARKGIAQDTWILHSGDRLAMARSLAEREDYGPLLHERVTEYLTACELKETAIGEAQRLRQFISPQLIEVTERARADADYLRSTGDYQEARWADGHATSAWQSLQNETAAAMGVSRWHPLPELNGKFPCCGGDTQFGRDQEQAGGCTPHGHVSIALLQRATANIDNVLSEFGTVSAAREARAVRLKSHPPMQRVFDAFLGGVQAAAWGLGAAATVIVVAIVGPLIWNFFWN